MFAVLTPHAAASGYIHSDVPIGAAGMKPRAHLDGNCASSMSSVLHEPTKSDASVIADGPLDAAVLQCSSAVLTSGAEVPSGGPGCSFVRGDHGGRSHAQGGERLFPSDAVGLRSELRLHCRPNDPTTRRRSVYHVADHAVTIAPVPIAMLKGRPSWPAPFRWQKCWQLPRLTCP